MNYSGLLVELNHYAMDYLNSNLDARLTYHNAEHAHDVAKAALKIAKDLQLSEEDDFCLSVAAWFHDTGYTGGPDHHEQRSSQLAAAYLKGLEVPDALIHTITRLIMATKISHLPADRLEEVIRDADLYHLGTITFEKKKQTIT